MYFDANQVEPLWAGEASKIGPRTAEFASRPPKPDRLPGKRGYDEDASQPAGLLPLGHCEASHGFKSATPVARKSAMLRVTIVMPWTSAVAAISPSR